MSEYYLQVNTQDVQVLRFNDQPVINFYANIIRLFGVSNPGPFQFARPVINKNDEIAWFGGEIIDFKALSTLGSGSNILLNARHRFSGLAAIWLDKINQIKNQGDKSHHAIIMERALITPAPLDDYLFYSAEKDILMLTGWGCVSAGQSLELEYLKTYIEQYKPPPPPPPPPSLQQHIQPASIIDSDASNDFDRRLARENAAKGEINISLSWENMNDLDLHLECPGGKKINYGNKKACGGKLDVDMNAGSNKSSAPVENITFKKTPSRKGEYKIVVHYFGHYTGEQKETDFKVRLELGGETQQFQGRLTEEGQRQIITVFEV